MCGRTSLAVDKKTLENRFQAKLEAEFEPIYNGAPSQKLPIIRNISPKSIELAKWGLLPKWLKEKRSQGFINAKAETIFEKPSFRQAIKERRCLVPADGFYEWSQHGQKVPFRITLEDNSLFAFAGLWESWLDEKEEELVTYSIITTSANSLIKEVHERMPVILPHEAETIWLDTDQPQHTIDMLLRSYPSDKMKAYRISTDINSVKNRGPEVIRPVEGLI